MSKIDISFFNIWKRNKIIILKKVKQRSPQYTRLSKHFEN